MGQKTFKKLAEAPEGFQPDVEVGDTFVDDADKELALVAAGWAEVVKEKKGDK